MSQKRFLWTIVASVVAATAFGCLLPEWAVHVKFVGDLFMNALKMVVLPLIVTSLIVGVTGLGDVRRLGSLGTKTIIYYLATTAVAVLIGMSLVILIQPGIGIETVSVAFPAGIEQKANFSFMEVITGLIHPNLIQAASEFDILPIIFASLLFGVSLSLLGKKGSGLISLIGVLNDAIMKVVGWIIAVTPIGVFGLIAHRMGAAGGGSGNFVLLFFWGWEFMQL
jgi:Na+/H+-dicarboxylate symporter